MKLPQKQLQLLNFVNASLTRNGFAPSQGEMAEGVGVSRSGIHRMLHELERKGYIRRQQGGFRDVQVVRSPNLETDTSSHANVMPFSATEVSGDANTPGLISRQADLLMAMLGNENYFKMVVEDDAMVGAGILQGDVAILRRSCDVGSGCVAAVVHEGNFMLRRLVKISGMFVLSATNERVVQRIISPNEVEIKGELATLLRHFNRSAGSKSVKRLV